MATVRSLGRFPFCVAEIPVEVFDFGAVADFFLPLGQNGVTTPEESFYEAVDVFWRVRAWSFKVVSGDAYPKPSIDDFEKLAGNSEKDLLCTEFPNVLGAKKGRWYGFTRTYEFGELAGEQESTILFRFLFGAQLDVYGQSILYYDNFLYYIPFFNIFPNGAQIVLNNQGTIARTGRLKYRITVSIESIESVTWELEPLDWWEYNPFDGGGPIYDKTTGAQLRDPLRL